jgi:enhancer of polycomb-like protein
VSAKEAKLLLKGDDELILAVYDYWIDRRLRMKQPLIPTVKSDKRDLVRTSNLAKLHFLKPQLNPQNKKPEKISEF